MKAAQPKPPKQKDTALARFIRSRAGKGGYAAVEQRLKGKKQGK